MCTNGSSFLKSPFSTKYIIPQYLYLVKYRTFVRTNNCFILKIKNIQYFSIYH
nr:MAG TPA: hypothetical protein [Caudoviricetes sp.]